MVWKFRPRSFSWIGIIAKWPPPPAGEYPCPFGGVSSSQIEPVRQVAARHKPRLLAVDGGTG